MTAERWRRIEQIYHTATAREPHHRAAYLAEACGGDEDLRKEVESLLARDPSSPDIRLNHPALQPGDRLGQSSRTMPLAGGTKLGPYEIIAAIGAGGMGEVYRARDPRVGREVAIKVAAERFSDRFGQEARAIAALNHSNICHLYDVGPNYLVMELVEGPTLAERIGRGAIPFDEAVQIARQIADALEAAHEKGITHRDLKPGNVKITPDGVVKVLDFGLAKLGGTPVAPSDNSPTITAGPTEVGVILGTAAYMPPEQAKGKPVDKRADIWAFGVVFYEMLTGMRPFRGETVTETLAAVIEREPKWDQVPAKAVPLLRRCLEKDHRKRLRDIGEAMAWLEYAPAVAQPLPAAVRGNRAWLWPTLGAAVLVSATVVFWAPWRSRLNPVPVRFQVEPSDKMKFLIDGGDMVISPDGHWMVFPAIGEDGVARYWVRSLDRVEARPLPGTETALAPAAWSFDSRYVLFTTGYNKLQKVDIQGGPPQFLADLDHILNGATWNKDGVILVGVAQASTLPLLRVPAAGGTPTPVTALAKGETRHLWPQFLPDGRHFLYQRVSNDPNQMGIYVGSLDVKPEQQSLKRLLASNREAYYAAAPGGGKGYLVFLRETTLMAQPFDPLKLELSGEPVPIADGVESFSVSDSGALVYRGRAGNKKLSLTWFDQNGDPAGTVGDPGEYVNPTISPDGTRVAASVGQGGANDIWILDVVRGTSTRFTFDAADDNYPVWSPDGKIIAFFARRSGQPKMYVKPADGFGEARVLADRQALPNDWSRDGRSLLFLTLTPKTAYDMWVLRDPARATAQASAAPILATPFNEGLARFSPDGRWIAYTSNESGMYQVYVQPFSADGGAGSGAKWLVSRGSGLEPRWRRDGKQLLYITQYGFDVMAVDIDTSRGFRVGTPRRLFAAPMPLRSTLDNGWDLTPDGRRFLFVTTPNDGRPAPYTVVLNWQAGLKN